MRKSNTSKRKEVDPEVLTAMRRERKKPQRKTFGDTGSNEIKDIHESMLLKIERMVTTNTKMTRSLVDSNIWLEINKLIVEFERDYTLALIEIDKGNLDVIRGQIRGLRLVRSIFQHIEDNIKL